MGEYEVKPTDSVKVTFEGKILLNVTFRDLFLIFASDYSKPLDGNIQYYLDTVRTSDDCCEFCQS